MAARHSATGSDRSGCSVHAARKSAATPQRTSPSAFTKPMDRRKARRILYDIDAPPPSSSLLTTEMRASCREGTFSLTTTRGPRASSPSHGRTSNPRWLIAPSKVTKLSWAPMVTARKASGVVSHGVRRATRPFMRTSPARWPAPELRVSTPGTTEATCSSIHALSLSAPAPVKEEQTRTRSGSSPPRFTTAHRTATNEMPPHRAAEASSLASVV